MSTIAFVFPGQGSQAVGMGKALAEAYPVARAVFDEVDAALGQNLSALMFEGPLDELTLTANAQPALMAVSMAAMRVLENETGLSLKSHVACVAGHSLGEYSALAAAGALGLADAARLLRLRGDAMQAAVPVGVGAMAAVLGMEYEVASEVAAAARQGEVCDVANDNGGGQVVVSGHKAAVERAIVLAQARGAKRALLLPVSAPFHCSLMQPAADAMADALARVALTTPGVPVVANVSAAFESDPRELKAMLVRQVTATVRWRESVRFMVDRGVTRFVEVGSGKVLGGLIRRIAEGASVGAVGTQADIATFSLS